MLYYIVHCPAGDPLLDNPTAKTPPPSYYACTSTFEETLPSYQEAATGVLGIQDVSYY